jgi:hypothetical protein
MKNILENCKNEFLNLLRLFIVLVVWEILLMDFCIIPIYIFKPCIYLIKNNFFYL